MRAITRIAVPELEPLLLDWCQVMTGAEIERTVRGFRRSTHPGAAGTGRDGGRSWRRRCNPDGTSTLSIVAPDEEIDELEQLCHSQLDTDSTADADVGTSGASAEASDAADGSGSGASAEADTGGRLVEALLHLAVAGAAGRADTSGLDRWTLTLHADLADLPDPDADADRGTPAEGAPASAEADLGGASAEADPGAASAQARRAGRQVPVWTSTGRTRTMSTATLRRLACEAGIVLVIDRPDGTPLDAGRRRREPTVAQRRALHARDRSCRFPGCGTTRHLHAHHVRHWADGGPTDLDNLVLICAFHHRFVHDHDWQLTPTTPGRFAFAPPDGAPVPPARPPVVADDTWTYDPLEDDQLRPRHRHGDQLDLHAAIDILHQQLRHAAGITLAA